MSEGFERVDCLVCKSEKSMFLNEFGVLVCSNCDSEFHRVKEEFRK